MRAHGRRGRNRPVAVGNGTEGRAIGVSRAKPGGYVNPKGVLSLCWCGRNNVRVTFRDVRQGRTVSCGEDGCHGPAT